LNDHGFPAEGIKYELEWCEVGAFFKLQRHHRIQFYLMYPNRFLVIFQFHIA